MISSLGELPPKYCVEKYADHYTVFGTHDFGFIKIAEYKDLNTAEAVAETLNWEAMRICAALIGSAPVSELGKYTCAKCGNKLTIVDRIVTEGQLTATEIARREKVYWQEKRKHLDDVLKPLVDRAMELLEKDGKL